MCKIALYSTVIMSDNGYTERAMKPTTLRIETMTNQPAKVEIGKVFKFGPKSTPNKVISVSFPYPDGSVPVRLQGPRGGISNATVYANGRCRKW